MKKILVVSLILLVVLSVNVPISAQVLKGSKSNVRTLKNPVSYQNAGAFSDGQGVWLKWDTKIESQNLGFYVYRVNGAEREQVSPFITGAYMKARENKITAGSYSFFDRFGDVNSDYVIESFHLNGQKHDSNLIQTRIVADLATIAGVSSDELNLQARSANPVVLGNESILPADLAAEVEENRPSADPLTQRWVAAQPGVKIGVKEEGLYRVSRASLETNGFDVNAPTERWQLYVNGVEQAIIVGANGDYIEFYGKGIDRLDSDTQTYFLIVGPTNGKRLGTTIRRRVSSSITSQNYSQSFFKKERFNYSSNTLNGDEENFFGTVIPNSGGTVNFNLTGVDFNSPNSSIDVKIVGLTLVSHQTKVILNNVELGFITGGNQTGMSKNFVIPTSVLREGSNSLQMMSVGGTSDINAFDSMKVNFARRYRAEQNRLSFYVPNYKASYAENFSSANVRVFDVTYPDAPILIGNLAAEQNGGSYRVYLPSNRGRVMFAVENSGIAQPVSITRNFPSTLSTIANSADLIIISHKDFLVQAEEWAVYRRTQGLSVKVVNVEDIFDEFNFGVFNADSLRNFLQYAKNNWQVAPNYVLLIGDGSYDTKNYQAGPNNNFVPTRMVDTIYMETGSDETLADFNNDGLAEIAVGRIPVRDAAAVTAIFDKMRRFELTVGQGLSRGAIFASDLPDGYDFEGLSNRLCDQLPSTVPCIKINRSLPNANALLVSEINNGRFLVNYSGHGTVTTWASNSFFSNTHGGLLTNTNNLSIFTMLTCLNGYFVSPTESLSDVLIKNPNGGAVTVWASTGLTTPDIQEVMATRFYNQIGAGNFTRIGDLIKDAKSTINFGRDVRLSWALFGDPTMKVR